MNKFHVASTHLIHIIMYVIVIYVFEYITDKNIF